MVQPHSISAYSLFFNTSWKLYFSELASNIFLTTPINFMLLKNSLLCLCWRLNIFNKKYNSSQEWINTIYDIDNSLQIRHGELFDIRLLKKFYLMKHFPRHHKWSKVDSSNCYLWWFLALFWTELVVDSPPK